MTDHIQFILNFVQACAAYPYADPYGLMNAYGNPAMVSCLFPVSFARHHLFKYISINITDKIINQSSYFILFFLVQYVYYAKE